MSTRHLAVLPYQRAVADLLELDNPVSFASLLPAPGPVTDEVSQVLLRSAYRLEPDSHPAPHAALARACAALGVTVPVELYAEEGGGPPNATYVHAPGRAYLLIAGPLLDLLDDEETCAVFGHELAHHVLWTVDGGRFLAAARLLDAAEADASTPAAYLETARRFRLATELFCDRGALAATGRSRPAVTGLLKVSTGLRDVDPEAYLRQAAEIDFAATGSGGTTHPETVLRAWALTAWANATETGPSSDIGDISDDSSLDTTSGPAEVEDAVAAAIGPALDLNALDLLAQDRLAEVTRELVGDALMLAALRSPEAMDLARDYGVTPAVGPSPASEIGPVDLAGLPVDTRRYLVAVLADLATASEDGGRDVLASALVVARSRGLAKDLEKLMGAELDLEDRERVAVREAADTLVASR